MMSRPVGFNAARPLLSLLFVGRCGNGNRPLNAKCPAIFGDAPDGNGSLVSIAMPDCPVVRFGPALPGLALDSSERRGYEGRPLAARGQESDGQSVCAAYRSP